MLTLVGGGAFGNPLELIWESIIWVFDEAQPQAARTLDVIVNGYDNLRAFQPEIILSDVRQRGGSVLRFNAHGLTRIDR